MRLLNCESIQELSDLNSWLNVERWSNQDDEKLKLYLTPQEYQEHKQEKKGSNNTFDLFKDYDAYYSDFLTYYQIDLMTNDIDFIRFGWLLDGLFCKKESAISQRIQFRTYKASKHDDKSYKKYMNEMKERYKL